MRKAISVVSSLLVMIAAAHTSRALEMTWEFSVQVSAAVQAGPPQITLSWPQDQYTAPSSYTVYRKGPGANSWGTGIPLPGSATNYVDSTVSVGTAYEYQVVKATSQYTGYGYVYAGINVPMTDSRGAVLLVVDNTVAAALTAELAQLQQDLVGDGWSVVRLDVDRNDSPANIRNLIKARYAADPANVKCVFLLGHVPVPYSGNIVPDGHAADHRGAWPADGYYGDMDGTWTDSSVNSTGQYDPRNNNVPGDGKFDQDSFPAPIKLMVGRVDLANLPGALWQGGASTFPPETELLRNYLKKNHRFRTRQFEIPRKALVGDFFGVRDGEAFAASGYRNFAAFFGASNIDSTPTPGTWTPTLGSTPYLWVYGGGAGSFASISGLGNSGSYNNLLTTEMYNSDIKAVFALLFGSWLGDWDSTDNILRAVLALPGYGLASAWSGRPHWFMHHMALGEPIGFSTRLTQKNKPGGLYQNQVNTAAGQVHIALMGDPTLRLHPVAPPANVRSAMSSSSITLTWTASVDPVLGYHVYRASAADGTFTRVTSSPVAATTYTDPDPSGATNYMIRAVKLEISASGSYQNPSIGAFLTPVGTTESGGGGTVTTVTSGTNTTSIDGSSGGTNTTTTNSGVLVNPVAWVDDALPTGAVPGSEGGDTWNWVTSDPAPYSGAKAVLSAVSSGLHSVFFWGAQPLNIGLGDVLFAYVYLDPANPPSEVMLQFFSESWEHRAYWGANDINNGTPNSVSRTYIGALPSAGGWSLLTLPASRVGLEGTNINGIAFSQFGGRAAWDYAGKASGISTNSTGGSSTNGTSGSASGTTAGSNTNSVGGNTNTVGSGSSTNNGTSGTDTGTGTFATTTNAQSYFSNSVPGVSSVDYVTPQLPKAGDTGLHIVTPTLLELKLINTVPQGSSQVTQWNLVDANSQFVAPPLSAFAVTANGSPIGVTAVGFKRRPIYAPLVYDLRVENSLYLQLSGPISDNQVIEVKNPDGSLWSSSTRFVANVDPLRYSPALHVNQEGYMPNYTKKAMVGYYAGSLGEVNIPASAGFKLVDANTGNQVFQGNLVQRPDSGYTYTPTPYQKVYEADFTSFNTPGEYRLVVPGMGGSLPFMIDSGVAMSFARAYALGLYHQRCGTNTAMPFTRFTHDHCHTAVASVPSSAGAYPFTWTTIAGYANTINQNNPPQIAPKLTTPEAQLFPYVRQGTVDVSGGHHDAGDYSKYTSNGGHLIHHLIFAVDSLPGVAALDNLGIPESGDGISDLLQEAKWEADYLAKMQDSDGGFYFLVYPKDRAYELDSMPNPGDPQVVWPKTTSVTAASVAALAQCATSPAFKQTYPEAAAAYLEKARLGWSFLTNAINRYGKNGAYQKITHYADNFVDEDELAWAACQMFLATGDESIHQLLRSWFDPSNPATWHWGWWHLPECYGHAIRSYVFAVQSGRATASRLDAAYLGKCQAEILAAANDMLSFSDKNAYGSSFPLNTKAVRAAGWYFSTDQAFDLAVAYALNPQPQYINAILANMNYEGGCNPVNVCYVTGLGWRRQRDIVSQWALNDTRVMPPSGIPVGNIGATFGYLWYYGGLLEALCFPSSGATTAPYPFYDRWGDSWNVNNEMVVLNQARSMGTLGFLAAHQASYRTQPWRAPANATINVPSGVVPVGQPITLSLQAPGIDLSNARVTWEARGIEPVYGPTLTISPQNNGTHWVEAEAQLPDGRRIFAKATFNANSPNIVWIDDSLPTGAVSGGEGGDTWNWVSSNPAPYSGTSSHQSAVSAGAHQHYFFNATSTLDLGTGDVLYAWVYLDPANMPSEIMLQWNDGSWEHRAYWGANNLSYGVDGTASRAYMGPLPAAGQWVQLRVPANKVGLEGRTISGMGFAAFGGRVTWDVAGRLSNTTGLASASLSVSASAPLASRLSGTPGAFTFMRVGDTNLDLVVYYSLQGAAVGGIDYRLEPPGGSGTNSLVIPAGSASATLGVAPLSSSNFVPGLDLVLNLSSNPAYSLSAPASATVAILGNTVPFHLTKTTNGATLRWTATANRSYDIAFKNNITDAIWTRLARVRATSAESTWLDAGAASIPQRFYLVAQVD